MGPTHPPPGAPAGLHPGAKIGGRYRLEEPLALGGMARVWTATDEVLDRPVAVKILLEHLAEDTSFVARFRAEALAAARLAHPSIVAVYDTCAEDGIEAIVMELIEGETLRQRLDAGVLAPAEAARIGARIAAGLAAAHQAGIVHRDIKPANVLLSHDGRVVVTDFGIAKAAEGGDLTGGGQMLGTAKYLAPEQVELTPVDGRTDLYALGVVLFEAVCGRVPFLADTDAATALARLHQDPPRPSSVRPGVPPELEDVLARLLARRLDDRWPDAASLARTLTAMAGRLPRTVEPGDDVPHRPDPETRSWRGPDGPPAPMPDRPAPSRPAPSPQPERSVEREQIHRPAPAPRVVEEPDHQRPRRGARVMLIGVVALSLLVIGVLSWQVLGPSTETIRPTATAYDPPFGAAGGDGENDDDAGLAVDGDPDTAWSTERYDDPDITVLKPGVGLILDLGGGRRLDRLRLRSPTEGWTAQVHVLDAAPDGPLPEDSEPVAEVADIPGDVDIPLGGTEGSVVVLWITRTGPDGVVEVAEATVEASR